MKIRKYYRLDSKDFEFSVTATKIHFIIVKVARYSTLIQEHTYIAVFKINILHEMYVTSFVTVRPHNIH